MKLVAMDLDGTLTQHKEPLTPENRRALDALAAKYRLVMMGAGQVMRIRRQMEEYPIDIVGNYGMQEGEMRPDGSFAIVRDDAVPCDRESAERRVTALREKFGYTVFAGDNVEFHPSGCLTFPLLGTRAAQPQKLAFDPDRKKRRAMLADVKAAFPEYNVFVGGSSSFDMAPKPFEKAWALSAYCKKHGIEKTDAVFIGDDYGPGGNDEAALLAGFAFLKVDDYRDFPRIIAPLLKGE